MSFSAYFSTFNITLPIFIIILVGYFTSRFKTFDVSHAATIIKLVFYIVMPVTLFFDVATAPVTEALYLPYLAAYFVVAVILILLTYVISKYVFSLGWSDIIINTMACYHTNTAYLALPIFLLAFHQTNPVAGIIVLQGFFSLAILSGLEYFKKHHLSKFSWLLLPQLIITNPIILGIFCGLLVNLLQIPLPTVFANTCVITSQAATFLAVFALGLSLARDKLVFARNEIAEIAYLVLCKVILHPVIAWMIGKYFFHLNHYWLTALVLISAMPTAKNLFIFAEQYQVGVKRSNIIVVLTTLFSFITINFILWWLQPI